MRGRSRRSTKLRDHAGRILRVNDLNPVGAEPGNECVAASVVDRSQQHAVLHRLPRKTYTRQMAGRGAYPATEGAAGPIGRTDRREPQITDIELNLAVL